MSVAEICKEHGISNGWKAKYAGAEPSQLRKLRELETENARLKCDLELENAAIKDVMNGKS